MQWVRNMFGWLVVGAMLPALFAGCHRTDIADDFERPYENEELLLPASSHFYSVSSPRGLAVDIAIDFEEKGLEDPPQLMVGGPAGENPVIGVRVPGSPMRRAVCGVPLDPYGPVMVTVQNQHLLRSIPFSLRIERAPSPICSPQTVVPSMVLVQKTLP